MGLICMVGLIGLREMLLVKERRCSLGVVRLVLMPYTVLPVVWELVRLRWHVVQERLSVSRRTGARVRCTSLTWMGQRHLAIRTRPSAESSSMLLVLLVLLVLL